MEITRYLARHGCPVDATTEKGNTALKLATKNEHTKVAQFLELWPAILRRYTIVASIKRVNENPELPVSGFLKRLSRVPEDMERVIMSFVGKGSALVTA